LQPQFKAKHLKFGFFNIKSGAPIETAKNNNFCGLYHNLTKCISKIFMQEMQTTSQVLDIDNILMEIVGDATKTKQQGSAITTNLCLLLYFALCPKIIPFPRMT
jgi:hypothetical protein